MAQPTSRQEMKEWCLRRLGAGAIDIEVTEEQVDDRLDYCLRMFVDYHFEGTKKQYYKYQLTANNLGTAVHSISLTSPGSGYNNTDIIVFEAPQSMVGPHLSTQANGHLVTNSSGAITQVILDNNGLGYGAPPNAVVFQADGITPSTGSGAAIEATLGGWIPIPDNIIGVVDIFALGNQAGASDLFNLRYQIVLNDLYMFNNLNIVPYVSAMYNVAQIEEVLVGKQPLRYSRYDGKLYIDMDWSMVSVGHFIDVKCYEVVDPEVCPKLWSDPLLQKYYTEQLREQWADNLSKYGNLALVGGNVLNVAAIQSKAREEIAKIEDNMQNNWWPIPTDYWS
jgi:hypothetical protein